MAPVQIGLLSQLRILTTALSYCWKKGKSLAFGILINWGDSWFWFELRAPPRVLAGARTHLLCPSSPVACVLCVSRGAVSCSPAPRGTSAAQAERAEDQFPFPPGAQAQPFHPQRGASSDLTSLDFTFFIYKIRNWGKGAPSHPSLLSLIHRHLCMCVKATRAERHWLMGCFWAQLERVALVESRSGTGLMPRAPGSPLPSWRPGDTGGGLPPHPGQGAGDGEWGGLGSGRPGASPHFSGLKFVWGWEEMLKLPPKHSAAGTRWPPFLRMPASLPPAQRGACQQAHPDLVFKSMFSIYFIFKTLSAC